MPLDTSRLVDRLHRVLVEEIRDQRPELLDSSFTVAEIYQSLVPYRSHRDRIGAEMNADYEDALLRLLAGEGEYVTLESSAARRQIREELESINPDTSVYRDFAAVEVRLNPERLPGAAPARKGDSGSEADEGGEAASGPRDEVRPGAGDRMLDWEFDEAGEPQASNAPEPAGGDAEGQPEGAAAPARPGSLEGTCHWCRGELPEREDLRFCPHCGSSVERVPCPECGAELEVDWHFCVACGAEIPA